VLASTVVLSSFNGILEEAAMWTEFGESLIHKMKDMGITTFIGEVSDPFYSPKITSGLVEFRVRYIQGDLALYKTAQLISESGEVYPVIVRSIGLVHPDLSANPSWNPKDLHVRVEGISIEKVKEMRRIVQEHVPD
jgi:hypothetical protein